MLTLAALPMLFLLNNIFVLIHLEIISLYPLLIIIRRSVLRSSFAVILMYILLDSVMHKASCDVCMICVAFYVVF